MRKLFKKIGRSHISSVEETSPLPGPTPCTLALHTIYTDENSTLNIIAIHGHGGHYTKSWTHSPSSTLWLKDLLPGIFAKHEIPIRVLSFEYSKTDEDKLGAEGVSAFLATETKKLDGDGVLWIAHSFGGPLLKGLLSTNQDLVQATKGVLFFGVPQDVGPGMWGNMSVETAGLSDEMKKLQSEVRWLGEMEGAFKVLCEEGKLAPRWFVEASGGVEDVNRGVSKRGDTVYLGKTHGQMIQFGSSEDEDWKMVEEVLAGMAEIISNEEAIK